MDALRLEALSMRYADQVWSYRDELFATTDANRFAGCAGLDKAQSMQVWYESVMRSASSETCPQHLVPKTLYLAIRESDNRLVGMIDLRHHIEHPILQRWGGHIGYNIRPADRRKGYGKEMLRLCLEKARELGLTRVLITCREGNIASEKIILANGGVYESTVDTENGPIRRFWITL